MIKLFYIEVNSIFCHLYDYFVRLEIRKIQNERGGLFASAEPASNKSIDNNFSCHPKVENSTNCPTESTVVFESGRRTNRTIIIII